MWWRWRVSGISPTLNGLNAALSDALSDETRSCILDLSAVEFIVSSMVHALIRWSKEAQLSEREAFAIRIAGPEILVARTLAVSGVLKRLPLFESLDAAKTARLEGRKPRPQRKLWQSHRSGVESGW
jgi:anti-anti-sigma regulatory factor